MAERSRGGEGCCVLNIISVIFFILILNTPSANSFFNFSPLNRNESVFIAAAHKNNLTESGVGGGGSAGNIVDFVVQTSSETSEQPESNQTEILPVPEAVRTRRILIGDDGMIIFIFYLFIFNILYRTSFPDLFILILFIDIFLIILPVYRN